MLPIILVLLAATSALALPSVNLQAVSINEVAPRRDSGRLVSDFVIDQLLGDLDQGDGTPYSITAQKIIIDLANQPDRSSQALAVSEAIALAGSFANGIPGDACAAADLIEANVSAVRSGNTANLRYALSRYIKCVIRSIEFISQLARNPNALRFSVGPRGNCNADGRIYQFESAWDIILSNASPSSVSLINEQYCAVKRLHDAHSSRNNNVGASLTAASLPIVTKVFGGALEPLAAFARALASGNFAAITATAATAKQALVRSANTVAL